MTERQGAATVLRIDHHTDPHPHEQSRYRRCFRDFLACQSVAAKATDDFGTIVAEPKQEGEFRLRSFETFIIHKTKTRKTLTPRYGEPVKRKVSPNLKQAA